MIPPERAKLEELTPGSLVKGNLPDAVAELVSAKWHGSDVIEVVYKDPAGRVGTEILFRGREPALELLTAGRPWSFDGNVIAAERQLGYEPTDVSAENRGYDVESRITGTGKLRFLEVKGRAIGADSVTITRNEIMTALNKPDDFILAIVTVEGEAAAPRYVRHPFQREPDFAVTSVNYLLANLLDRAAPPA